MHSEIAEIFHSKELCIFREISDYSFFGFDHKHNIITHYETNQASETTATTR